MSNRKPSEKLDYSDDIEEAFEGRGVDPAKMQPHDRFRHVVGWHIGDPNWAGRFIRWAKECGYEIKETGK